MPNIAIQVDHLSKQYHIGRLLQRHDTLRDALVNAFSRFKRASQALNQDTIWALRDISFQVNHGEAVGIIGRNGAGKSTLLKILSLITEPTAGRAIINGRVGSLLEVGTGFHPELTGRENIYLNGAILGMTRKEIDRKFDEIVDFAEIEKFLDTPVKRYSSGMYVRLAFAVAAHLEPEILLVDEVLAVGDATFQKKCLGKLVDVANEGRTVLFVSHNLGAIASLTRTCIYLKNGQLETYTNTKACVEAYLTDSLVQKNSLANTNLDYYRRDRDEHAPIKIIDMWVNHKGEDLPKIPLGQEFAISFEVQAKKEIIGANIDIIFRNSQGENIVVIFSWDQDFSITVTPGNHILTAQIRGLILSPGIYFVESGINQTTVTKAYDVIKDYPIFQIVNNGAVTQWLERPWGLIHHATVHWGLSESPAWDPENGV